MSLVETITGLKTFKAEARAIKYGVSVSTSEYDLKGNTRISKPTYSRFSTFKQGKMELSTSRLYDTTTGGAFITIGASVVGVGLAGSIYRENFPVVGAAEIIGVGLLAIRVGIGLINEGIKSKIALKSLKEINWF